jgi:hypothetical protein
MGIKRVRTLWRRGIKDAIAPTMSKSATVILWTLIFALLAAAHEAKPVTGQEFLTFEELVTLSDTDQPGRPLAEKLDRLLTAPILNNDAALAGIRPHRPYVDGIGPVLRVVSWNIERGLNFDLIRLALSDPDAFTEAALRRGKFDENKQARIEQQLRTLRDADIVVLNEVDLGMKRTDYRDVARDLAQALGMNYVFGVEFLEVDRLDDLGLEKIQLEDPALTQQMREDLRPDRSRYLGLHGSAILSRYPIQNAHIFRLPVCHDWYQTERMRYPNSKRVSVWPPTRFSWSESNGKCAVAGAWQL